ncbi:MAG TPA: hypothetical protein VMR34_04160 [Candidatus Saccharimonadales bacterium]|nr:hypothetical protein [Candidatus Saccharimonadales bacterium]
MAETLLVQPRNSYMGSDTEMPEDQEANRRQQTTATTTDPSADPNSQSGDLETLQRNLRTPIQVIDVSEGVASEAADHADEYIRLQTTQRGVRGFFKKIWHGNIARDYIRQREIKGSRQEIIETENLGILHGSSKEEHDQAMAAVIGRYTSEYGELLHSGETNQSASEIEGGAQLEEHLHEVVSAFARGDLGYNALVEEKTRILNEFGKSRQAEDRNKGLIYADNIVEVATNARAAFEHGVAVEAIDVALGLKIGEARVGVRTQSSRELVDKAIDKLYSSKAGSLVNETTLASAAAIVMGVTKFTVRKIVTAVSATVGLGVGTGIIAGIRETHHVGQERRQHARQMAEGGQIDENQSSRRSKMEETRYETTDVDDLLTRLRASQEVDETNPEIDNMRNLIAGVSDVQTRIRMSDDLDCDLIRYESKESVEQQRLDLDIALAISKVSLRNLINNADDSTLLNLGVQRGMDVDELIDSRSLLIRESIESDISAKNRAFNKLRLARAASAAAVGATVGMVIGSASQEIHAALDNSMQGVFDHAQPGQDRRTELAALFHSNHMSNSHTLNHDFSGSSFQSGNGALNLPSGYHVEANSMTGIAALIGPGNHLVGDLSFNPDGHLTSVSQKLLEEQGFKLHSVNDVFQTSHMETSTETVSPTDYVAAHSSQFTEVHRQLWYDNDTPYSDLNELKGYWGNDGSGIDGHGNFTFDVSHMTATGSFEGSQIANAPELIQQGHLAIAVSLNQATQNNVILVPINPSTGQAIFNPNLNPIFSSMFKNEGGQAHFTGGYLEVVQLEGSSPAGGEFIRPLATVVGQNQPATLTNTVQSVVHQTGEHVITNIEAPATQAIPIEVAPVIPLRARSGLEDLNREERIAYGYGQYSPEQIERPTREMSPRLRDNPDAVLSPGEELSWYRSQLPSAERAQLDSIVSTTPELSDLPAETRAIVCIPVGAVSEADNIYNALSLYEQQDQRAKSQTTILLHVNWIDDTEADPVKKAAIDKTIAEIERAKADFPDLKIASFQTKWRRPEVELRGGVIGEVARRLFDTALMSVQQSNENGRHAPSQDVLIIRNDADAKGMGNHYLSNLLAASDGSRSDAFVGTIRWQTDTHRNFPGFGVVSNFLEVMHAVSGLRGVHVRIPTIGINVAVKASALAAVGCLGQGRQYSGAGSDDLEIGHRIYAARDRDKDKNSRYGNRYSTRRSASSQRRRRLRLEQDNYPNRDENTRHLDSVPISVVKGAGIDTNADRVLTVYRNGRPITTSWDNFDSNGGQDRSQGSDSPGLLASDDATDIDQVAQRVEQNISEMASRWFTDPEHVRMGLAFTFPEKNGDGEAIYNIKWQKGVCEFSLTESGKEWLQNRLTRDGRGRFDPFGRRVRRALYHETAPSSKRQPASVVPRFVQALA